jgi:hypothetical protein
MLYSCAIAQTSNPILHPITRICGTIPSSFYLFLSPLPTFFSSSFLTSLTSLLYSYPPSLLTHSFFNLLTSFLTLPPFLYSTYLSLFPFSFTSYYLSLLTSLLQLLSSNLLHPLTLPLLLTQPSLYLYTPYFLHF